ncbi:2Fe-2S iron-sulfur cluster-binding protein [Chelatococcus sp. GCM10030263]|uniref:xanthine dehydrogenase family Fe-S subunit n=1 Tax=Chelatococcus sp. GCM10030263 TaxID=3273387 RepID=UPI00360E6088
MSGIELTVNGRPISGEAEPRMHLGDFLRERLHLTATHLRCEQGVCGACTLLIDGEPARSCITYAVSCRGAEVMTLEGLETDPVIEALRAAFTAEHGLQCGFCTPGMLVTARDIVLRLPDADAARVRKELSGNLCRCTGYAGIVRAICRVLAERQAGAQQARADAGSRPSGLGPVGSRIPLSPRAAETIQRPAAARDQADAISVADEDLGLGGRQANLETALSFVVARPIDEVWAVLDDIERVARCMPGAKLAGPPVGGRLEGTVAVKVGPIATSFSGRARILRDEAGRSGVLYGAGRDRLSGSGARAEVSYALVPDGTGTRVDLSVRALLAGPLAQFGRSGIVQDLMARLAGEFARRLEHSLATGEEAPADQAPLNPAALLVSVIMARVRKMLGRFRFRRTP